MLHSRQPLLNWLVALAALAAVGLCPSPAHAIPTLQLHFPDPANFSANPPTTNPDVYYDAGSESWVAIFVDPNLVADFYIDVVGAKTPDLVNKIEDVNVYVAVPEGETGDLSVMAETYAYSQIFAAASAVFTPTSGTPPGLNSHGVYPSPYYTIEARDLIVNGSQTDPSGAPVTVLDYSPNPEYGTDVGDFVRFHVVSEGFSLLQFDATGWAISCNTYFRFAPYSHNALVAVPEPGTLLIVGMGMGLLGCCRAAKRRRRGAQA